MKRSKRILSLVAILAVACVATFALTKYEQKQEDKCIDKLLENLKLFQARSKLILLLCKGDFSVQDPEKCMESLKPFLGRKMLLLLDEVSAEIESLSLKARMIIQEV